MRLKLIHRRVMGCEASQPSALLYRRFFIAFCPHLVCCDNFQIEKGIIFVLKGLDIFASKIYNKNTLSKVLNKTVAQLWQPCIQSHESFIQFHVVGVVYCNRLYFLYRRFFIAFYHEPSAQSTQPIQDIL